MRTVTMLQALVSVIRARPSYRNHLILDGGKLIILVRTTDSWFVHIKNKWVELNDNTAFETCKKYGFAKKYKALKDS